MEELVLYSKWPPIVGRALLCLILSAGFGALSIGLILNHGPIVAWIFALPALALLIFFGLYLHRLIRHQPVLVANRAGLTVDNFVTSSLVTLRWDEIADIFILHLNNFRYLSILPVDAEALWAKDNRFGKFMHAMNWSMPPIYLPEFLLPEQADRIIAKLADIAVLNQPEEADEPAVDDRGFAIKDQPEATFTPTTIRIRSNRSFRDVLAQLGYIFLFIPSFVFVVIIHINAPQWEVPALMLAAGIAVAFGWAYFHARGKSNHYDIPTLLFVAFAIGLAIFHGWGSAVIAGFVLAAFAFTIYSFAFMWKRRKIW